MSDGPAVEAHGLTRRFRETSALQDVSFEVGPGELYGVIAKDTGERADNVSKAAADRHFKRAKKGEYLKYKGEWRKKA